MCLCIVKIAKKKKKRFLEQQFIILEHQIFNTLKLALLWHKCLIFMLKETPTSVYNILNVVLTLISIQVQVHERNNLLVSKLNSAQNKLGQQAASKSDLSVRLVQCEEDKLKVGAETRMEICHLPVV